MNNSPSKFIITCAPRTGSTMLRMMLNSHPEVVCLGEVFSLAKEPNLGKKYHQQISKTPSELSKILAEEPVKFLYDFVLGRSDCKAIGVKIKYKQLESEFPDVFQAVLNDPSILIIHLSRTNLLKRYVSNYIAARAIAPALIRNFEEKPGQVKISIDPEDCLKDILLTKDTENRFRKFLNNKKVFEIAYEDLLNLDSKTVIQLQNFLGIAPINLLPKTKKINSDNLADILENYDEVKNKLANTPYASYFE